MDNKIFNVNGRSEEQLLATLKLLMLDEYGEEGTANGWIFDPKKGFVIVDYGNEEDMNKFPAPLSAEALTPMIWEWLKSDDALSVPLGKWEVDCDHDGHNNMGFRVFSEDWGHVGVRWGCHAAVKPVFCWYGK